MTYGDKMLQDLYVKKIADKIKESLSVCFTLRTPRDNDLIGLLSGKELVQTKLTDFYEELE